MCAVEIGLFGQFRDTAQGLGNLAKSKEKNVLSFVQASREITGNISRVFNMLFAKTF